MVWRGQRQAWGASRALIGLCILMALAAGRVLADEHDQCPVNTGMSRQELLLCRVEAAWQRQRPVNRSELPHLRSQVGEMFDWGFSHYMRHAFPRDNLLPISCKGANWQGGIGVTLIDSLDALLIMSRRKELGAALQSLQEQVTFNKNEKVHVFEVTIRVLGGLLSTHVLLQRDPSISPGYDGQLLAMATDMAERMLPAFETQSGVPLPWAHLQGRQRTRALGDNDVTDTAAAGTLLLEFGLLSQLTGNQIYVKHAHRAARLLFARRSSLGLVGGNLHVKRGAWVGRDATIGPGADSFYEYLLKAYLMLGDEAYLEMFAQLYADTMRHLTLPAPLGARNASFMVDVQMDSGRLASPWVSSLGAFWPGMQAMIGQEEEAVALHANFTAAWRAFGWLPEAFGLDLNSINPENTGYNLRPEHMESTYLLHSTTGDPSLLALGATLARVVNASRAVCGFSGITDVTTGATSDLMESFLLSETLKYLYLLFTEGGAHLADYFVLSTEGHPLPTFAAAGEEAEEEAEAEEAMAGEGDKGQTQGESAERQQRRPEGEASQPEVEAAAALAPAAEGGSSSSAPGGSKVPRNCRRACAPATPAELAAAERLFAESMPLVPLRRRDALRLRRRSCRACIAVAEALAATPPASSAERAHRLNGGRGALTSSGAAAVAAAQGTEAEPIVLGQVVCEMVLHRDKGLRCGSVRLLVPGALYVSLPANAVVLQLLQHPPAPRLPDVRLLVSVEVEEGPMVLAFQAAPAVFGPPAPVVDDACLAALAQPRWRLSQQVPCPSWQPADAVAQAAAAAVATTPAAPPACDSSRLPLLALRLAAAGSAPALTPHGCPGHPAHIGVDASRLAGAAWLPGHITCSSAHACAASQLPASGLPASVLVAADPPDGCGPLRNARMLEGAVAVVHRGGCSFGHKAEQMERAGARGMVVLNLQDQGELLSMKGDTSVPEPSFPLVLLARQDALTLLYWMQRRPAMAAMVAREAAEPLQQQGQQQHTERAPAGSKAAATACDSGQGAAAAAGSESCAASSKQRGSVCADAADAHEAPSDDPTHVQQQQQQQQRAAAGGTVPQASGEAGVAPEQATGDGEGAAPEVSVHMMVTPQGQNWLVSNVLSRGIDMHGAFEQLLKDERAMAALMMVAANTQQQQQQRQGQGERQEPLRSGGGGGEGNSGSSPSSGSGGDGAGSTGDSGTPSDRLQQPATKQEQAAQLAAALQEMKRRLSAFMETQASMHAEGQQQP